MKRSILLYLSFPLLLASCGNNVSKEGRKVQPEEIAVFSSTDSCLQKTFDWAKKQALGYAHDSDDPVGPWYEAALPNREAFCMRDVAHQTVGAHILGLARHNKNMMRKFVSNISESRDYCSYWEINRYDKPAPADYTSDSEFWYNLNANHDVMQACLKLYEWTADSDFISDSEFLNFYDLSTDQFISRWQLQPDRIMSRPPYMNQPPDFVETNNFHSCRGLPSYVENFRGLTVGVDLVATLYGGFHSYSKIAGLNGDTIKSAYAAAEALRYREIIDSLWWDDENMRYNTFWTEEGNFYRGEGVPFILWFDATDREERIRASVDDILSREWNVENMSAFPAIFYKLGYSGEAYRFLTSLPSSDRSEYPEVSFGLIEGIVCGAMGMRPSASEKTIGTLSRVEGKTCEIRNVPLFDGFISLRHDGTSLSEIENNTGTDLIWEASFVGSHPSLVCEGKLLSAGISNDIKGNTISSIKINLPANSRKTVKTVD